MKQNSNMVSLGLALILLFGAAFKCNDNRNQRVDGGDKPASNGGAECTTQEGIGKKYGMRDPRICTDTKAPTTGAITADLAAKYFMGQTEKEWSNNLYLVENVKVEVGGGIPYDAIKASRVFNQVDVNQPVYPIRGSYTSYQCRRVYDENDKPFCNVSTVKADGYCYKTTFGDWQCHY